MLIEEKEGNRLELTGTGKDFLNRTLLAQALRSIINKWSFMKLKSFCKAKDTIICFIKPIWVIIFYSVQEHSPTSLTHCLWEYKFVHHHGTTKTKNKYKSIPEKGTSEAWNILEILNRKEIRGTEYSIALYSMQYW